MSLATSRRRLPARGRLVPGPCLLLGAAFLVTDARPAAAAKCATPWETAAHLDAVMSGTTPTVACTWEPHLTNDFNPWEVGGSENHPVVAAAIALYIDPLYGGADRRQWWKIYLEAQLGLRESDSSLPLKVKRFAGSEAFSKTYWTTNTTAVLAVHYWARVLNAGSTDPRVVALRDLAGRFLKVNAYIQALAAVQGEGRAGFKNGNHFVDLNPTGYSGPYVALACGRTLEAQLRSADQGVLLAKATGLPLGNPAGRYSGTLKRITDRVLVNWNVSGLNAFGLTASDAGQLRALVESAILPPGLNAVLSGVRTRNVTHFLIWNGVRCSLIEENHNGNTPPIPAICFHRNARFRDGMEVHFLNPYTSSRASVPTLRAFVDLQGHYMEASQPGGPGHEAATVAMNIPSTPPLHHIVLPLGTPPPPTCRPECRLPGGACDPDCPHPCQDGCSELCPRRCPPLP